MELRTQGTTVTGGCNQHNTHRLLVVATVTDGYNIHNTRRLLILQLPWLQLLVASHSHLFFLCHGFNNF